MSMTLIAHQELVSPQASIVFTSIPQTFTDLLFVFSTREPDTTNTGNYVVGSFNGTTTGYVMRELIGNGSTANTGVYTTGTAARIVGYSQSNQTTANTFASSELYIPNYRAAVNKTYSITGVMEAAQTTSAQLIAAGLWSNTAAITSVEFIPFLGTRWAALSSVTLYGITAGSAGGVVVS
jgi:hypothetical protein